MTSHDNLRKLAMGATPGPWRQALTGDVWSTPNPQYGGERIIHIRNGGVVGPDAAYIAAANPKTVLGLLDEIERLRGEVACAGPAITEVRNHYERQLTAMTAARDELADIAEQVDWSALPGGWKIADERQARVQALRGVGKVGK